MHERAVAAGNACEAVWQGNVAGVGCWLAANNQGVWLQWIGTAFPQHMRGRRPGDTALTKWRAGNSDDMRIGVQGDTP
jgi:hypothetical protein